MNPFRLLDIGPLRGDPTFRRFWTGTSLQALAGQLSAFAVLYQMWEMTHSSLMTGMVGLTLAVPMVAFGLWGGLLADTRDKRGLILLANVGAVFLRFACSCRH
ncbi:MFS transporter (plasmid) [Paracoccus marcusii]|uniref:MFS transporter n=1 Tax=Paracoccus marcusii TaxID=59779 RepID=UPI002ED60AC1|nr:MFS transporter [Paracoccus marcusii]